MRGFGLIPWARAVAGTNLPRRQLPASRWATSRNLGAMLAGVALLCSIVAAAAQRSDWDALIDSGDAALMRGDAAAGVSMYLSAIDLSRKRVSARQVALSQRLQLATSHIKVAAAYFRMRRFEDAIRHIEEAIGIYSKSLTSEPAVDRDVRLRTLSGFHDFLGDALVGIGDVEAARRLYRAGLEVADRMSPSARRSEDVASLIAKLQRKATTDPALWRDTDDDGIPRYTINKSENPFYSSNLPAGWHGKIVADQSSGGERQIEVELEGPRFQDVRVISINFPFGDAPSLPEAEIKRIRDDWVRSQMATRESYFTDSWAVGHQEKMRRVQLERSGDREYFKLQAKGKSDWYWSGLGFRNDRGTVVIVSYFHRLSQLGAAWDVTRIVADSIQLK